MIMGIMKSMLFALGFFKAIHNVDKSYSAKKNFYITFLSFIPFIVLSMSIFIIVTLGMVWAVVGELHPELFALDYGYFGTLGSAVSYVLLTQTLLVSWVTFYFVLRSHTWLTQVKNEPMPKRKPKSRK